MATWGRGWGLPGTGRGTAAVGAQRGSVRSLSGGAGWGGGASLRRGRTAAWGAASCGSAPTSADLRTWNGNKMDVLPVGGN